MEAQPLITVIVPVYNVEKSGMSKTSPKTKGRREKEGGDYPTKRKSA